MTRNELIETMARGIFAREAEFKAKWPVRGPMHIGHSALLEAALTAIEAAGMRVVPVEPSEKMRVAALNVGLPNYDDAPLYAMVWRSMVLATQEDNTSE